MIMERQYTPLEESNLHKLLREPTIVKYFSEHKDEWIEGAKKEAESDVDVFYYMRYKLLNLYRKTYSSYWEEKIYEKTVEFVIDMDEGWHFDIMKCRFDCKELSNNFLTCDDESPTHADTIWITCTERFVLSEKEKATIMDYVMEQYMRHCVLTITISPDDTKLYGNCINSACAPNSPGVDFYFGDSLCYTKDISRKNKEYNIPPEKMIFIFPAGFDALKPFFSKEGIDNYIRRNYYALYKD